MIRLALALLFVFTPTAFAQPARNGTKIDVESCPQPQANVVDMLGPSWQAWGDMISLCGIRNPAGQTILQFLTVRIDILVKRVGYWAPFPSNPPQPLLFDRAHRQVGKLASAPSGGTPGQDSIFVSDWQNGFPHRIDVLHENDAAFGTHWDYPLIWNPKSNRYEPGKQ